MSAFALSALLVAACVHPLALDPPPSAPLRATLPPLLAQEDEVLPWVFPDRWPVRYADAPAEGDEVLVQYLGVGTVVVSRGDTAFVFPTTLRYPGPSAAVLKPANELRFRRIFVIPLHGHYDHANDPQVFGDTFGTSEAEVTVLGNREAVARARRTALGRAGEGWVIEPVAPVAGRRNLRFVELSDEEAGDFELRAGTGERWELRFTFQEHAPHKGASGKAGPERPLSGYTVPLLPGRCGPVRSALLTAWSGERAFRVFVNDAATSARAPGVPADPGRVDLAVLTAADAHLAWDYPRATLAALAPRQVWWGHWEEFVFHGRAAETRDVGPLVGGPGVLDLGVLAGLNAVRPDGVLPLSPLQRGYRFADTAVAGGP